MSMIVTLEIQILGVEGDQADAVALRDRIKSMLNDRLPVKKTGEGKLSIQVRISRLRTSPPA